MFDSMSAAIADYDLLRAEHIELTKRLERRDKEIARKEIVIQDQMKQKWGFKRLDSLCEVSNMKKDSLIASYAQDFKKLSGSSYSPFALTLNAGYGITAEQQIRFKPVASIGLSYTIIRFKKKN